MNPINFGRRLLVGLAAMGLALSAAAPALAAEPAPPAPAAQSQRQPWRLERAYLRAQHDLEMQAFHLSKTDEVTAKTQALIDRAKGEGKDTSGVEAALAAFEAAVPQAEAAHAEAAAVLASHAGFDDNGQVTEAVQARETIEAANEAMREARELLRDAERDLRQAIRDFVRANRPAQPTATP